MFSFDHFLRLLPLNSFIDSFERINCNHEMSSEMSSEKSIRLVIVIKIDVNK